MIPFNFSNMDTLLECLLKSEGYGYIDGSQADLAEILSNRGRNNGNTVLYNHLEEAVRRLNPTIPAVIRTQSVQWVLELSYKDLFHANEIFSYMLRHGISVEYRENNRIKTGTVRLLDFDDPTADNTLAVRRLPMEEGAAVEFLDLVIFINGLPLVVFAVADDPEEFRLTGLKPLYNRLCGWKKTFPAIFRYNVLLVISDGRRARAGSLTASFNRFIPWRSLGPESIAPLSINQLQLLMGGLLNLRVLKDVIRFFTLFEKGKKKDKKIATYYQYYAVNEAVTSAVRAAAVPGRGRCGVVRHTQGSGKSLTMLFYVAKLISLKKMLNPTIVIITDRSDLDNQLFELFCSARDFLGRIPIRAERRFQLRNLLRRNSGGIIFTTIQKFFPGKGKNYPLLSIRSNIIVLVDEAHRSQYGFIDGFARHLADALPHASFTGFTGTPLEKADRNTRAVFGDYIDVYDVKKAIEDGVTVPIYYESRVKELNIPFSSPGAERAADICRDLVEHFESRCSCFSGKALVAVESRNDCINLYSEIVRLRPDWHKNDDFEGRIKAVITGTSSDPAEWQPHIRDKTRRRVIGERLKDPADPLKIVIVCDMWLTGFDAPCLHTLYIDKSVKDHILVQAMARVNRVFEDKTGGLVVDYRGIAPQLKKAISVYMEHTAGAHQCLNRSSEAARLEECHEGLKELLRGFDYKKYFAVPNVLKESVLSDLREYILSIENGREIFIEKTSCFLKAFGRSIPHPSALRMKDTAALFRSLKSRLSTAHTAPRTAGTNADIKTGVRQLMTEAVVTGEIVDVLDTASIKKNGFSVLTDEFLFRLQKDTRPYVAAEYLIRLLSEELTAFSRRNLVRGNAFTQQLRTTINGYRRNRCSASEAVENLSLLAREVRNFAACLGQKDLTPDELALYDALTMDEDLLLLWDENRAGTTARQLAEKIKQNAVMDWAIRESTRAGLRVAVKRTLRLNGFPMHTYGESDIVDTLLKQAELLAASYSSKH